MDDHVANELFGDFSPPPKGTTQPASLKAKKILSAIATSFPKKNEIGQIQTPDSGDSPQQPKKLGQRQMPVPKTPAAPRLMPLPNARLAPQPRSAAAAAMMPHSPLESVMKKANLKQTTLNWTPSRKRILDQPAASPAARAETPSTAAAPTAASQSAQPPRLKSILKQTKLHWPQAPGRHFKRRKNWLEFPFLFRFMCTSRKLFFYWC